MTDNHFNKFLDSDDPDSQYPETNYEDNGEQITDEANSIDPTDYKLSSVTNFPRFFHTECSLYEFSRRTVTFKYGEKYYRGKPVKEIDRNHYIFLIDTPSAGYKKINVADISVLLE